jgi:hypothetical protein
MNSQVFSIPASFELLRSETVIKEINWRVDVMTCARLLSEMSAVCCLLLSLLHVVVNTHDILSLLSGFKGLRFLDELKLFRSTFSTEYCSS